jgi:hypothetical protein
MTTIDLIRRYGVACAVSGVALAVACLVEVMDPSLGPRGEIVDPRGYRIFMLVLGGVVMPGFLAGQIGYHRSGAAGGGVLSKTALIIGAIGCGFIALPSLLAVVTLGNYGVQLVGQLATMMIAPLLFGIAALRAKRVRPWKRVWPLAMGLWPPLMFGFAVPAGFPAFGVPGGAGMLWAVLGYALWSDRNSR